MGQFVVTKTSALQTAVKAAVDIAIAELGAGLLSDHEALVERSNLLKDTFAQELFAQVDADNQFIFENEGPGSNRYSGNGRAPAVVGPISIDEARATTLNFGAFKGLTLGEVAGMDDDQVKVYTNGKQRSPGLSYIEWLSKSTKPQTVQVTAAAKVLLDDTNKQVAALALVAQGI